MTTVRMSIRELEKPENRRQRFVFLKAWHGIQKLDPSDSNSFWQIASYHGEPFVPREVNPKDLPHNESWGGYCQHGNVLFPLWHRFYVWRIEKALQSIEPDAAMHYWDQTSAESLEKGMPDLLTDVRVVIDDDGTTIPNPLKQYTFQKAIVGEEEADEYYEKPLGYTTMRYPFSGIRSPLAAKLKADEHNKALKRNDEQQLNALLNRNVIQALVSNSSNSNSAADNSIDKLYEECLQAPTYNIFSNIETAGLFKEDVSLEAPHNHIHLAVGGYDINGDENGIIRGANGDMGENETAAFDPIFFLHHCNVDRMFWVWQQMHGATANLTIDTSDPSDPGITSTALQGPTPWQKTGQVLDMTTALHPYENPAGGMYTGADCINIADLGFNYTKGSLTDVNAIFEKFVRVKDVKEPKEIAEFLEKELARKQPTGKMKIKYFFNLDDFTDVRQFVKTDLSREFHYKLLLKVENIPREKYPGSFFITAYYVGGKEKIYLGKTSVLDRWKRKNCQNCQLHRYASATFRLDERRVVDTSPSLDDYLVEIVYHAPMEGIVKIVPHDLHQKTDGKISGKFFLTAII